MIMLVHLRKRADPIGDGMRLNHIHGNGAVRGMERKMASDQSVQRIRFLSPYRAAVGHEEAAAVFHITYKRLLYRVGLPGGVVFLGSMVAFAQDNYGVTGQCLGLEVARVVDDIEGKALVLQRKDAFGGDVAGMIMVVAK
jgi:hypothetical protein